MLGGKNNAIQPTDMVSTGLGRSYWAGLVIMTTVIIGTLIYLLSLNGTSSAAAEGFDAIGGTRADGGWSSYWGSRNSRHELNAQRNMGHANSIRTARLDQRINSELDTTTHSVPGRCLELGNDGSIRKFDCVTSPSPQMVNALKHSPHTMTMVDKFGNHMQSRRPQVYSSTLYQQGLPWNYINVSDHYTNDRSDWKSLALSGGAGFQ